MKNKVKSILLLLLIVPCLFLFVACGKNNSNQTGSNNNNQISSNNNNQTDGDNNQTDGDNNQTDGDNNQTDGDNNQTDGDNNQTDGDNNQTDGEDSSNVNSYSEGLIYMLSSDKTYYIVSGAGTCEDSNLNIPNTYNSKPVKEIGANAFVYCANITNVLIPDSVISIGSEAFYNCINLTSIIIGKGVTSIGNEAFHFCYKLVEVYNLSNLNIEKGSKDNKNADSIEGNQNVGIGSVEAVGGSIDNGYVGYYAKDIYTSLDEQSKLKTSNGVVYYINENEKIAVAPEDINATSIVIDNDCTEINQGAFCYCVGLTEVIIPNSVTTIGGFAFEYCSSLTEVTIPNSVTSIGDYIFYYCSSLTSVSTGNSVTRIGINAFLYCVSLTEVTISNSVTSIGNWAFDDCSSLEKVYYKGTSTDWNKISIGNDNSYLTNATRYYYSETQPTLSGNYWHYDTDGKTIVEW